MQTEALYTSPELDCDDGYSSGIFNGIVEDLDEIGSSPAKKPVTPCKRHLPQQEKLTVDVMYNVEDVVDDEDVDIDILNERDPWRVVVVKEPNGSRSVKRFRVFVSQ
tara:strand:+ start:85 stop:405 length:321 start_codon:yes stop_codon:yes gene_type:complete